MERERIRLLSDKKTLLSPCRKLWAWVGGGGGGHSFLSTRGLGGGGGTYPKMLCQLHELFQ